MYRIAQVYTGWVQARKIFRESSASRIQETGGDSVPHLRFSNSIFLGPAIGTRFIQPAHASLVVYGHATSRTDIYAYPLDWAIAHSISPTGTASTETNSTSAHGTRTPPNGSLPQTRILTYNPTLSHKKGFQAKLLPGTLDADRARFELAEGCPSTVFKTVSLDRSDICPMCITHETPI